MREKYEERKSKEEEVYKVLLEYKRMK